MLPNLAKSKVLLIDDDPSFGALMKVTAEREGVDLTYYPSLAEMGSVGCLGQYNLIMVDLHLESMSGTEIAEYVDIFFCHTPVVLISADRNTDQNSWPHSIKGFVSKSLPSGRLLQNAFNIVQKDYLANMVPQNGEL